MALKSFIIKWRTEMKSRSRKNKQENKRRNHRKMSRLLAFVPL